MSKTPEIHYWSDILCVWAYVGQARANELAANFATAISLENLYFPVFGAAKAKLDSMWASKGGRVAYNRHVHEIVARFGHLPVTSDIWLVNTPESSLPAHLYICAAQWLEQQGELAAGSGATLAWQLRAAFFGSGVDISRRTNILAIAEQHDIAPTRLEAAVASGAAFARLAEQAARAADAGIKVSPTFSFNEGRQRLSGNVGYRIIEANIREWVEPPALLQAWC